MKLLLLLFGLLVSLYADMEQYALQKEASTQGKYFIKFAACKNIENARKIQLTTDFPTQIIHMRDYYSIVSNEFQTRDEAKATWKKIKKDHKNAYIFKLYKKDKKHKIVAPNTPKKPKIEKHPNRHQSAIALYNAKRYEEALMEFDMILIDAPNDINAKIYYAKTLYKLSLFKEARKEFQQLLKTPLDQQTQKEIRSYIKSIEKKRKKHFFNTSVDIGVGHDDNINLTTNAELTQYGPYTLINDTNKTESTYGLVSLSFAHRYIGEFFNIYSSLYNYNEFAHTADGNDLNYLDISSGIGKSYKNFMLFMPIGFNKSYLDGEDIGHNLYTNPSLSYSINPALKAYVQSSFLKNSTNFDNNRDYHAIGGGLGVRYNKENTKGAIGASIQNFSAEEDLRFDINKDAISFFADGKYYFTKRFYAGANLYYKKENYKDLDTVMGYKREDKIVRLGVLAHQYISKNTSLYLQYQYTKNDSNINVYTYDKNNYVAKCKYKF